MDDPGRVKDIIGATAQLEDRRSEGRSVRRAEEEALAAKGGILPINTEAVNYPRGDGNASGAWYLVSRSPVITGQDMRKARAAHGYDSPGTLGIQLHAVARKARSAFSASPKRISATVSRCVLDNQIRSVANIQSAISDSGRINGLACAAGSFRSRPGAANGRTARWHQVPAGTDRRTFARRRFDPARASWPASPGWPP